MGTANKSNESSRRYRRLQAIWQWCGSRARADRSRPARIASTSEGRKHASAYEAPHTHGRGFAGVEGPSFIASPTDDVADAADGEAGNASLLANGVHSCGFHLDSGDVLDDGLPREDQIGSLISRSLDAIRAARTIGVERLLAK